jgi:ribokinase
VLVVNAAPSRDLPDDLWRELDVLVVNEHEAADLASVTAASGRPEIGETPEALADALLARVPAVVITLGPDGSLVARRGTQGTVAVRVPGMPVDAVDTTGAGDTYCGVLAAALARGADLVDAARPATAAAALAVTRPGAQDAVPSAADVAALAEREPIADPPPPVLRKDR